MSNEFFSRKDEFAQPVVVGINYKTSTISEREPYQSNKKDIRKTLNYFRSVEEVEAIVIVSTCNRLEFYFTLKPDIDAFSVINDFYFKNGIINSPINKKLFYSYIGTQAAEHLFKVASGLDSMLIGEYQIQGQIKDAYSIACSEKTADKILHKLFHAAFRVGKAVRTNTKIGSGNQSLSGVAFNVIKEKINREDAITIVGINQNTKIIAEKLNKTGYTNLFFVNRTLCKAKELADEYNGLAFRLDNIEEPLTKSKCVFSCTGAPGFIIASELINKIYSTAQLPKLLIDMAIPRDINTEGLTKDIEIINLEGLKEYLEAEKKEIAFDLPEAERIISNEVNLFEVWNESQVDDTVSLFSEKIEVIRLQLLDEMKEQVSDKEIEALDKFSRSLVHRMKTIINQAVKTAPVETIINN